jgi:hypothetical protein
LEELITGITPGRAVKILDLDSLDGLLEVEIDGLSSGAEALVVQFTAIAEAVKKLSLDQSVTSIIVLVDEGDAFLHIAWQQRYVKALDDFVASICPKWMSIQLVISTHSPVLMSDFPRDYIHRVWDKGGLPPEQDIVSFAAPLEKIIESTAGAGTIGEFAADIIRSQIALGANGDRQVISWVDDPLLKSYLLRRVDHVG